jgi:hypothetical protein
MGDHDKHAMHGNSIEAYADDIHKLSKRAQEIYSKLCRHGKMTDRQVLKTMFPDSDDMNLVRPRLTDLKKQRFIVECGDVDDAKTGKLVRLVRAVTPEERAKLIAAENGDDMQARLL